LKKYPGAKPCQIARKVREVIEEIDFEPFKIIIVIIFRIEKKKKKKKK